MPTERFFNLSEDKKKRIIDASLKEFSRVPFEEISINRIIQDAGISRGSFYQYFEDKTDLQTYLLSDYFGQIKEKLQQYLDEKRGDMFTLFEDGLHVIVEFGLDSPYCDVCKNVFAKMGHCNGCQKDSPFAEDGKKVFSTIVETMKKNYYKNYDMEDLIMIWDILLLLVKEAVLKVFVYNFPKEEVIDNYLKKVEIIKIGFKAKENRNA